ncbi:MAG TPA: hypothetical protein VFD82_21700 [Planctomycetota bacterium]|nr:hypothetical protein [Planctomycetota bacterium]
MSRAVLAASLLLLTPALAIAQASDVKPAATQQDPEAAYKELVKAYNKAISDWRGEVDAAVKKAQAEGTEFPPIVNNAPTKEFVTRAQELAAEYAGKDEAIQFLGFVCKYASKEINAVKKAVQTLAADHATSPAIRKVLPYLAGPAMRFGVVTDPVKGLLDEVAEKHTDADCKAQALLTRGTLRLQTATNDEQRKAAEEDLRKVATVAKDQDLTAQAKDALFEIENLQVGCTAPDIVAKDTDGVAFKLSDYRGKVVLLDFWGFW